LFGNISMLIRSRNAFLTVMMAMGALKLILSAISPASFDLRDMIAMVASGHFPVGPWILLYPRLYNQTPSALEQLKVWSLAAPPGLSSMLLQVSLLFRLPVFAFDVSTAIALYFVGKRMASPVEGMLASLLWFINPYSLFSIELLGVPDVAATFLMVMALWMAISERHFLSGLFLGLGVWVKLFPVLLLPPLLLYAHSRGVRWKSVGWMLCLGLIGLVGYLSWIFPFGAMYLTHYTPVTQPLSFIAGEHAVNGSALWLILFYCLLGFCSKRIRTLLGPLLLTLLVYYALSNPYPQYVIWAMPLMALDVALVSRRRGLLLAFCYALAFVQWFFASSAFLTPSGYSFLMIPLGGANVPWYSQAIGKFLDSPFNRLFVPLVSSGFYASVLVYAADVARSCLNIGAKSE